MNERKEVRVKEEGSSAEMHVGEEKGTGEEGSVQRRSVTACKIKT